MCTTGDTAHIDTILKFLPHMRKHVSSCQKKKNLSFPVAVNNSFKVGPLVFLLQMFVIKENIMKRPIFEEFKL